MKKESHFARIRVDYPDGREYYLDVLPEIADKVVCSVVHVDELEKIVLVKEPLLAEVVVEILKHEGYYHTVEMLFDKFYDRATFRTGGQLFDAKVKLSRMCEQARHDIEKMYSVKFGKYTSMSEGHYYKVISS